MKKVFSSLFMVVGIIFSLASAPAYIYFLIKAAKLDHWIAFVASLVFPPIGMVGGALVYLGLIWQAAPRPDQDIDKQELLKSRAFFSMLIGVTDKCRWPEISNEDRLSLTYGLRFVGEQAKSQVKATDSDLALADGAGEGAGRAVDCSDAKIRQATRSMINQIQAGAAARPGAQN